MPRTTNATGTWPLISSVQRQHRGLQHGRMALQVLLDLARVDVLAAADEHVVVAADEVEEAVGVAAQTSLVLYQPSVRRLAVVSGWFRYPGISRRLRSHRTPSFSLGPPTSFHSICGTG